MSSIATWKGETPHGTRTRYTRGCRCDECKRSNVVAYHRRQAELREVAVDLVPSGPPLEWSMLRGGHVYSVKLCAGTGGASCVRGGSWLRTGARVCSACVAVAGSRALVDATAAREHVFRLARRGVGYKQVADAAHLSPGVVLLIRTGERASIRPETACAILGVSEDARADHGLVSSTRTRALIRKMLARGFTKAALGRLLGATTARPTLQIGIRDEVTLANAAKVERLWKRIRAREVLPPATSLMKMRTPTGITATRDELLELRDRGVDINGDVRTLLAELDALRELRRTRRAS